MHTTLHSSGRQNKLGNRIRTLVTKSVVDVLQLYNRQRTTREGEDSCYWRYACTGRRGITCLLFQLEMNKVCQFIACANIVPTSWSSENWSLKYVGTDRPNLNDYQSFKQIQGQSALSYGYWPVKVAFLKRKGDLPRALEDYDRSLHNKSEIPTAYANRGIALLQFI